MHLSKVIKKKLFSLSAECPFDFAIPDFAFSYDYSFHYWRVYTSFLKDLSRVTNCSSVRCEYLFLVHTHFAIIMIWDHYCSFLSYLWKVWRWRIPMNLAFWSRLFTSIWGIGHNEVNVGCDGTQNGLLQDQRERPYLHPGPRHRQVGKNLTSCYNSTRTSEENTRYIMNKPWELDVPY